VRAIRIVPFRVLHCLQLARSVSGFGLDGGSSKFDGTHAQKMELKLVRRVDEGADLFNHFRKPEPPRVPWRLWSSPASVESDNWIPHATTVSCLASNSTGVSSPSAL